jgi:hypothetical protein
VVSEEAKYKLAHDGAREGNVGNIFVRVWTGIDVFILSFERGVDRTNDLEVLEMQVIVAHVKASHVVDVAIREETGATGKDGQSSFNPRPLVDAILWDINLFVGAGLDGGFLAPLLESEHSDDWDKPVPVYSGVHSKPNNVWVLKTFLTSAIEVLRSDRQPGSKLYVDDGGWLLSHEGGKTAKIGPRATGFNREEPWLMFLGVR